MIISVLPFWICVAAIAISDYLYQSTIVACSMLFVWFRSACFDVRCKSLNVILIGSVIIASVLYVQGTRSEVIRVISILYVLTSNNTTHKIENKRKARPENKKLTRPTLPSFILAKCTIPPHPFWILTHDSYEWQLTLTTKGDFYKWWLRHVQSRDGGHSFATTLTLPSIYPSSSSTSKTIEWINQWSLSTTFPLLSILRSSSSITREQLRGNETTINHQSAWQSSQHEARRTLFLLLPRTSCRG